MNKATNTSPAGELGTIARRLAVAGAVTLACLGATSTQEAYADAHGDLDVRPYVGVGMEYVSLDLDSPPAGYSADHIADSYLGVNLHFGARFGSWFGAELGFFQTQTEEQDLTVETTVMGATASADFTTEAEIRGVYLDLLGYLPIADEGTDLIGSIGFSRVTFDGSGRVTNIDPPSYNPGPAYGKQTETVMRFGLGIQHHINENLSVKGLYRRHNADDFTRVGHADSFHLGLNYHF